MAEPVAARTLEGGCLCGSVRFRLEGEPVMAGLCHCSICRRQAGAAVIAAGVWPRERFRLLGGNPAVYASSERGRRHFCRICGTSLFFEPLDHPGLWEVWLGTLDDANAIEPTFHICVADQLPWLDIRDDRPRYPRMRRDGGAFRLGTR